MKTISKRFLKGALAMLLAVVMLFGTTLTGFAAVVDNAETGSVNHTGGYVYFLKPSTWTESKVMMFIGHNSYTDVYEMTKVSNTDNLYRYQMGSWGGATYVAFANAGSLWGGGNWGPSNRTNAPHYTNVYNEYGFNSGSYYVCVPASTSNNAGISINYKSSSSALNLTTTANVYAAAAGSTSYSSNAAGGTVSLSGRYMSGNNATSARTVAATAPTASNTFAPGSTVTFTATPKNGYEFVGWSTSSSESGIVSTSATYNFKYDISYTGKTLYALFKAVPTYSVTYNANGGSGAPDPETGLTSGSTHTVSSTKPTYSGYNFKGWKHNINDNVYNAGDTFNVTSDVTLTAQWAKVHTITYNANNGTGAPAAGSVENGSSYTVSSTVPTRTSYNFTGWNTAADGNGTSYASGATISNVTTDMTLYAQWELAGVCSPVFADTSKKDLVLGETFTRTATFNGFNDADCKITYSSSATDVATVDANSGKVTALKAGTTTITASCSKNGHGTATYTVEVLAPEITVSDVTADVNGTATITPSITNAPKGTYSYAFESHASNSNFYAINETTGVVTGLKPTTTTKPIATVKVMYDNGNGEGAKVVESATISVHVNEPTASLSETTLKLLTGQTAQLSVESSVTPDDIAWTPSSGTTVSNGLVTATAASTGTGGNVTATVKYNEYYSKDLTCSVTVTAPSLTVNPATLDLEFGGGTTEGSITVANNDDAGANGTDAVAPVLTVTSSETDVATANVNADENIDVTATGVGTTTLTISYRGVTEEVTVNVTKYNPYFTVYLTNNKNFNTPNLWYWNDGAGGKGANMIYIGKNKDGQNIFAYRFLKSEAPDNVLFRDGSSYNTVDIDLSSSSYPEITDDYAAFYLDGNNVKYSAKSWSMDLVIPTVTVDNVDVVMGETETAEATVLNGDKVLWSIEDSDIATVANVDTKTTTVTSVAPGYTTITARAFIDTANSSIKQLPTNYATDTACWDYISSFATATVTVEAGEDRVINVAPKYTNDGETYNDGVIGGTVNATYENQSGTTINVPYNGEYVITATPAAGYAFNGWLKNNTPFEGGATLTVNAKDNASYIAQFIKTYTVTVATPTCIETIKINNNPGTTYTAKAGDDFEIFATPAEGYRFDSWTVSGTADVENENTATLTIRDIQSDLNVTPKAVKIYTVNYSIYTNGAEYNSAGTVTGVDNGQEFDEGTKVTLVAESTSRNFYGWYAADDTNFETPLSTDPTYVIDSLDKDIDVIAMFYRPFTIEGLVPGTTVELAYDIVTDTYTGTSNDYQGNSFTVKDTFGETATAGEVDVTGGTHTGATVSSSAGAYTLNPDLENYNPEAPITYTMVTTGTKGIYKLNITLSDAVKVNITVDGVFVTEKAVGSKFSYEITAPQGQYLSNATTTPAVNDIAIVDGKVEFTVPNTDVDIRPVFANYSYVELSDDEGIEHDIKDGYKAGEEATITISPASDATSITGLVSDYNDGVTITQEGRDWKVVINPMPADTTITLTPTKDVNFIMNSGVAVIGNYGTGFTTYGTVTMKIGDTTLAQGDYAAPTDTVTYTASPNTNFIFDGFYSDAECTPANLLSRNTSYNVTPKADTTVYALFVPKHYLAYDQAQTGNNVEMDYNPEERAFTHESSTIAKDAWFRVTNNTSGWNDGSSYSSFGSGFSVSFNEHGYNLSINWGTQCFKIENGSSQEYPFTIVVTLDGNTSIDVSARTVKNGYTALLSSGRHNIAQATTTLKTEGLAEGITTKEDTNSHDGDSENYLKITNIPLEGQTISWETQIGGTNPEYTYIEKYIVYKIESGTWEIITPVTLGENKYSGSTIVNGDCYIYPVYFRTDAYRAATGYVAIEMYFDASAIQNLKWGPFVSCYAWDSTKTEKYFGSWPGQIMIPTEDGKSFYTEMNVPKAGSANQAAGVTFSNYMFGTCPVKEVGLFGITNQNIQTYDYREAITLYEAGYEVITFVAKTSKDGYHGDEPNGVTQNKVEAKNYSDITETFTFDYLYSRDGVTPMDFNGEKIENPKAATSADYYVVSKGDRDIGGGDYSADTSYNGDWSVEWYIFDSNGNHEATVLSTALWHDITDNDVRDTVLLNALGLTPEQAAGKTVAISYEHPNQADAGAHQLAYDGQWYGNMLDHTMNAQVKVGFQTAPNTFVIDSDETPNVADYGEGYLDDLNGGYYQSLDVTIEYGYVDLHAVRQDGYTFIGWYTQQADGSYKKISDAFDVHTFINMDETYYAMFREVAEGEVIINHSVYNNPNDPAIPSHGGVSQMSIRITTPDDRVLNATPSMTRTSLSFDGVESDDPYIIDIITTPLMNGEFFAWYTDSTKADGTKTYEEVFTDGSQVGSNEQVVATFEYYYSPDSQKIINIYSDIKRVSNKADFIYKYFNRYGELRTYTVKDIELTDQECLGFDGNENQPYVPAYLTAYKFMVGDKEIVAYEGTDLYDACVKDGGTIIEMENKVSMYAPSKDVTEVYNGTLSWNLADATLTTEKSLITLTADQGIPTYTVYYEMAGEEDSKTDFYNELLQILAPATNDKGDKFSYWMDKETGDILTYTRHYNYRIMKNRSIIAVYGATVTDEWTPTIEYVEYTREFGDNGDVIYTDYHLAYTSRDGKELNVVKGEENIKYGLLVLRDSEYYISDIANVKYPDVSTNAMIAELEKVANGGSSVAFTVDSTTYNCYCYDLTKYDLTNFNRCDYFRSYDNTRVVGKTHYYREYAFTAVAYLIDKDGNVHFSTPEYVNFYELGNQDPTENSTN